MLVWTPLSQGPLGGCYLGPDCTVLWLWRSGAPHLALEEEGLQVSWCKAYLPSPAQDFYLLTFTIPILQVNKMRRRKGTDLPQVTEQRKWRGWEPPRDSVTITSKCQGRGRTPRARAELLEEAMPSSRARDGQAWGAGDSNVWIQCR